MLSNVARILDLLARGYDLESIDSDHGQVEARLRRGALVRVVSLTAREAEELLFGPSAAPLRRR